MRESEIETLDPCKARKLVLSKFSKAKLRNGILGVESKFVIFDPNRANEPDKGILGQDQTIPDAWRSAVWWQIYDSKERSRQVVKSLGSHAFDVAKIYWSLQDLATHSLAPAGVRGLSESLLALYCIEQWNALPQIEEEETK